MVFYHLQKRVHPRTYEVAGQLIQTVSQVSQDLLGLQSRLKRLKEVR